MRKMSRNEKIYVVFGLFIALMVFITSLYGVYAAYRFLTAPRSYTLIECTFTHEVWDCHEEDATPPSTE